MLLRCSDLIAKRVATVEIQMAMSGFCGQQVYIVIFLSVSINKSVTCEKYLYSEFKVWVRNV